MTGRRDRQSLRDVCDVILILKRALFNFFISLFLPILNSTATQINFSQENHQMSEQDIIDCCFNKFVTAEC